MNQESLLALFEAEVELNRGQILTADGSHLSNDGQVQVGQICVWFLDKLPVQPLPGSRS
jgi:hypothetical protein